MPKYKFVQLASNEGVLYALDEFGHVYIRTYDTFDSIRKWKLLEDIREE